MVQVRVSVTRVRGNMMQSWLSEGCRTGRFTTMGIRADFIWEAATFLAQIVVEQCSGPQSRVPIQPVPEMRYKIGGPVLSHHTGKYWQR
jgi:hypothetical protein